MLSPPEEIVTSRLRLRPPTQGDAQAVFDRWCQDAEVTRYLVWSPHRDISETEAHIARCLQGWVSGDAFVWLLEHRGTGVLLGSLAARNHAHGVNLGYVLARDAWGHGYMAEALQPVVSWFLAQAAIHRVWATCDHENHASARVLEKAGFEFEGILRRWESRRNSGRRDARRYSRIR